MSDYMPMVRDRVRIVLEGEVEYVGAIWLSLAGNANMSDGSKVRHCDVVSVEKLSSPLPTTPGSVVRSEDEGIYFFRQSDGGWRDHLGSYIGNSGMRSGDYYEVIFDAGAES